MSRKVELCELGIDAFNRRDPHLFAEHTTADFEWIPAMPGLVEGGAYRGRAGIETYLHEIASTWEELRIVADELRDHGHFVLIIGRVEGRGKGSGVEVESPIGLVFEFRGEELWRSRGYLDPAAAAHVAAELSAA